jgi:hypothetical protein
MPIKNRNPTHSSAIAAGATARYDKSVLWIVNHKTLMSGEVPLLRSLGFEVFVRRLCRFTIAAFRSAGVTYEYDAALDLAPLRCGSESRKLIRAMLGADGHPNYKPML